MQPVNSVWRNQIPNRQASRLPPQSLSSIELLQHSVFYFKSVDLATPRQLFVLSILSGVCIAVCITVFHYTLPVYFSLHSPTTSFLVIHISQILLGISRSPITCNWFICPTEHCTTMDLAVVFRLLPYTPHVIVVVLLYNL